jgi:hypothetical protein
MKLLMEKPKGRIVLLESPNPMDLLQGRTEIQTLAAACRLIGYEAVSFTIRSQREFLETCQYLSTIETNHDSTNAKDVPLFVHISCHGNDEGLAFGKDSVNWEELSNDIDPLCNLDDYPAGFILSISACGAGEQKVTKGLSTAFKKRKSLRPPHYLFVTDGEYVLWDAATVAWVALYHHVGKVGIKDKVKIQKAIGAIKTVANMSLLYFRWDQRQKKYLRFQAR